MQAKISIEVPDKAIKQSRDLKYVFVFGNFRIELYRTAQRLAQVSKTRIKFTVVHCGMQERVERVNAQKSLISKETETYYAKGTLNTCMGTF